MAIHNNSEVVKKNRSRNKKIVFDDEIITKDSTSEPNAIVSEELPNKRRKKKFEEDTKNEDKSDDFPQSNSTSTVKRRSKKKKNLSNDYANETPDLPNKPSGSDNEMECDQSEQQLDESDPLDTENSDAKKEESIRAKKRKRHMELLQTKKLQSEVKLQEKCLNYLSMWKHSKFQWKFEKLKQIWLQQNMFDNAKVPEEFWDTLVEYFNSAKGQAKANILAEAVKIVDSVQPIDDEGVENSNTKYLRARNIVQNLQE